MKSISLMCLVCVLSLTGCGGALGDVLGSYEGTSELYNATNFGMNNQSVDDVITLTTVDGSDDQILIGLESECALLASVEDDVITVSNQSCDFEGQSSSDTWLYEGSGQVDGDTLTLDLKGTFTRVYEAGPLMTPPLNGNHRLEFKGTRQ